MYRRTSGCKIDGVWCGELKLSRMVPEAAMSGYAQMVFTVGDATAGTCKLIHDEGAGIVGNFSPATLKKLEEFLASAEKDMGKLLFEAGVSDEGEDSVHAESDMGLKTGIGGSK